MRYVLVYSNRPDLAATVPPELMGQAYGAIAGWFEEHGAAFVGCGAQLEDPGTAKTVRHTADGDLNVTDGPYTAAQEQMIGFSVIDVPDQDAAVAIARTFPLVRLPGGAVEVRPIAPD
jgi:hypothetical protein